MDDSKPRLEVRERHNCIELWVTNYSKIDYKDDFIYFFSNSKTGKKLANDVISDPKTGFRNWGMSHSNHYWTIEKLMELANDLEETNNNYTCDCGALKSNTTHAGWCSINN